MLRPGCCLQEKSKLAPHKMLSAQFVLFFCGKVLLARPRKRMKSCPCSHNTHSQPSAPWFSQVEIMEIRPESSSTKIAVNTSTSGCESSLSLTLFSLYEPRLLIHPARERHDILRRNPLRAHLWPSCVSTFSKRTHSFVWDQSISDNWQGSGNTETYKTHKIPTPPQGYIRSSNCWGEDQERPASCEETLEMLFFWLVTQAEVGFESHMPPVSNPSKLDSSPAK